MAWKNDLTGLPFQIYSEAPTFIQPCLTLFYTYSAIPTVYILFLVVSSTLHCACSPPRPAGRASCSRQSTQNKPQEGPTLSTCTLSYSSRHTRSLFWSDSNSSILFCLFYFVPVKLRVQLQHCKLVYSRNKRLCPGKCKGTT